MKIKHFVLAVISLLCFQTYSFAKETEIYDIHQHYVPESYKQALLKHGTKGTESDGLPLPKWSVEEQLKFMDKFNIKTAYISLATPHPYWNDEEETINIVREINNEGAEIVKKYPERFKLLATLPLPNVENSIKEIDYAYDTLNAVGIKLPTNAGGIYLGEKDFEPVFEKLNERKAVIVLHPVSQAAVPDTIFKQYPPAVVQYLQETTTAVMNLILSGTLEKYTDIKIVIPHGGSLLPALADRLEAMQGLLELKAGRKLPPIKETLSKFYYDLAGFPVPNQLYGLLNMTDADHLLYGSDYPYAFENYIQPQKEKLEKNKLLTKKQKTKIFKQNTELLFK